MHVRVQPRCGGYDIRGAQLALIATFWRPIVVFWEIGVCAEEMQSYSSTPMMQCYPVDMELFWL